MNEINNKYYEKYKNLIDEIYSYYDFLNIKEKVYNNMASTSINEIISENKIDDEKKLKFKIINKICNYVHDDLLKKTSINDILISFIDKFFINIESASSCIVYFNKINNFMSRINYDVLPENIYFLLKNSEAFDNALSTIFEKYKSTIFNNRFDYVINNKFLLSSMDFYLNYHDIENDRDEDFNPDTVFKSYVFNKKLLTNDETINLIKEAQTGNIEARDLLVESNIRLVFKYAKQFNGDNVEDLIQEGTLGLIRAIELFDTSLGYRFSTYATWWIKQFMYRSIENTSRTIRIPSHAYVKMNRIKKMEIEMTKELGRHPYDEELSERCNININEIKLLKGYYDNTVSLNSKAHEESDDELISFVEDKQSSVEDKVINDLLPNEISNILKKCNLTDREFTVIIMRFGLYGNPALTLEEIGKRLGVTRERIRQIERTALKKIRRSVHGHGLGIYTNDSHYDKTYFSINNSIRIYDIFKSYYIYQVNDMISLLNKNDRIIFDKKFSSKDYTLTNKMLDKNDNEMYINYIYPKMIYIMSTNKKNEDSIDKKRELFYSFFNEPVERLYMRPNIIKNIRDYFYIQSLDNKDNIIFSEDTVSRLIDIIQSYSFCENFKKLTIIESIVLALRYGFTKNSIYSYEQITSLFNITDNNDNKGTYCFDYANSVINYIDYFKNNIYRYTSINNVKRRVK